MHPVQLKMARAALDLSIEQLAAQAGLSHVDIARMESGESGDEGSERLRMVFEEAGILFIDDDTVKAQLKPAAATIPLGDLNSYNDE